MVKIVKQQLPIDPLEELSPEQELQQWARTYQKADSAEKNAKTLKDDARKNLMRLMTAMELSRPLHSLDLKVDIEELEAFDYDPKKWVAFHYPEHNLVSFTNDEENYHIVVEENPELTKYEFNVDGYRFGRTLRKTGASFDIEAFTNSIEQQADLFQDEALNALDQCITEETTVVQHFNEAKAHEIMQEWPETVRFFQRHTYSGKPAVQMLPVVPAGEDDLV